MQLVQPNSDELVARAWPTTLLEIRPTSQLESFRCPNHHQQSILWLQSIIITFFFEKEKNLRSAIILKKKQPKTHLCSRFCFANGFVQHASIDFAKRALANRLFRVWLERLVDRCQTRQRDVEQAKIGHKFDKVHIVARRTRHSAFFDARRLQQRTQRRRQLESMSISFFFKKKIK